MEPEFESIGNATKPCVYCLVYKGKVMYVGQSAKPFARFHQHTITKKSMMTPFGPRVVKKIPFDDVWIRPCMSCDMDALEVRLIQKYRPQFNIKHNEDLVEKVDFKELIRSLVPAKASVTVHPTIGHINRRI